MSKTVGRSGKLFFQSRDFSFVLEYPTFGGQWLIFITSFSSSSLPSPRLHSRIRLDWRIQLKLLHRKGLTTKNISIPHHFIIYLCFYRWRSTVFADKNKTNNTSGAHLFVFHLGNFRTIFHFYLPKLKNSNSTNTLLISNGCWRPSQLARTLIWESRHWGEQICASKVSVELWSGTETERYFPISYMSVLYTLLCARYLSADRT